MNIKAGLEIFLVFNVMKKILKKGVQAIIKYTIEYYIC